ncbi:SANT associated [Vigna unguiculata]|uniref:SANT associated n=1 Tax=Vigna unguiculata TaxID=3917 RepID=A0A4D6LJ42_VIGUN|nr:SANT associated [Vigna unguiculata]
MAVVGGGDGGGRFRTTIVPPNSVVFLNQWWLVKHPNGLGIGGVSSVGDRERAFASTVITVREEANVIGTHDGVTIVFRGFINTSRSSHFGVPLEVSQRFLVGFPYDWSKYSSIDNMKCESNNSEKGIPVETQANVERQANVESQASDESSNGMYDSTGPSGKNILKTQTSAKKRKADRQKIGHDADNLVSRRVTRSISKNSESMPKEDGKAPIADVFSPVRRSPRLYSRK